MSRAGYDPSEFAAVLAKTEPVAMKFDTRGEKAVRADFDRRNAAAAKFASEFAIEGKAAAPILPGLKTLLAWISTGQSLLNISGPRAG